MGDIIHTLPALTDAATAIPGIKFTWLVDDGFQEISAWHPAVEQVIPIALRKRNKQAILASVQQLRKTKFDLIIDAQGLLKSAILTRLARGVNRAGYNKQSCREAVASFFYNRKYNVDKQIHAIDRTRQLFAQALGYELSDAKINYGINWSQLVASKTITQPYLMFLHGTTWDSKHWPEEYWIQLANLVGKLGFKAHVTWATPEQKSRAQRLAMAAENVVMLDHLTINQAAEQLHYANGVVAVDTGFAHLAAAMSKPLVGMYGPTDINKCGVVGAASVNLNSKFVCAPCGRRVCDYPGVRTTNPPCFTEISPQVVWENLAKLLTIKSGAQA